MLFRYPGGKGKVSDLILAKLKPLLDTSTTFHDVFVGGGSIAIAVAQAYPNMKISINDLNENMFSFWSLIASGTDEQINELKAKVSVKPTIDLFMSLRREAPRDIVDMAYYAIFFNRCTFSGIETAGPIGGMQQKSKWKVDCRYNIKKICSSIDTLRELFKGRLTVSNLHFRDYLKQPIEGCMYLDPPYFEKGIELYSVYMKAPEHVELFNLIHNKDKWILSYDDCEEIRELYFSHKIETLDMLYSINGKKKNWAKKSELIVSA